jgi:hypothetical protein
MTRYLFGLVTKKTQMSFALVAITYIIITNDAPIPNGTLMDAGANNFQLPLRWS